MSKTTVLGFIKSQLWIFKVADVWNRIYALEGAKSKHNLMAKARTNLVNRNISWASQFLFYRIVQFFTFIFVRESWF